MLLKNQESFIIVLNKKNMTMKKFIITDPCYIVPDENWCEKFLKEKTEKGFGEFDFDDEPYVDEKDGNPKQKIKILKSQGTPNGDGSGEFNGQELGVDAGLLCVAYCEDGWDDQRWGVTFETLEDAKNSFNKILEQF